MSETHQNFVLEPDAIEVLRAHHVPYPDHAVARDAEQAVRIADGLGYPVVLKIVSPDVVHKSDAGGVAVNLGDAEAVRRGYEQVVASVRERVPGAAIEGILVCRQAPPGLEVIVGALEDRIFGPVVMFGLGGVFTEVLKDVSFRLAPFGRRDAEEMVREIRGQALLAGVRGQAARDTDALADLLVNVSELVAADTEIKELDLNPVRLYEHGLMALDVRLITQRREDR